MVHYMLLKNNPRLTLRRAEPRDAEQLLAYLNQVTGESENITFGPGEFGMSVLHSYWNLGIGSHMLAYPINWAKHTGTILKINLRLRIDNFPVIHLYEKYGFVQEGRVTRKFYLHGQGVAQKRGRMSLHAF